MKQQVLFLVTTIIFLCSLVSCEDRMHFSVEGNIKDADIAGKTIYLERVGVGNISMIDSAKIGKKGNFKFNKHRPVYPDFYRVRLEDRTILFGVDSTETIEIRATGLQLYPYEMEGTVNIQKMNALRASVLDLEQAILSYDTLVGIRKAAFAKTLENKFDAHEALALKIIYDAPASNAAYFALFHKVNNVYFFDIFDDSDMKLYSDVAYEYNAQYPHSTRSKFLISLVLETKRTKGSQEWRKMLLRSQEPLSHIDISLPDENGHEVSLSALNNKATLLVFSELNSEYSVEYVYTLQELYNTYSSRGFNIYEISFDADYEFFKSSSGALPWHCVFDKGGLNSPLLQKYDITQLPTYFLLNDRGDFYSRHLFIDKKMLSNLQKLLDE